MPGPTEEPLGPPQSFTYSGSPVSAGETRAPRTRVPLCKSDILSGHVEIVRQGGENNLHSHTGNDGFWLVLSGRARFYTEDDRLLAEMQEGDGLLIPRNTPYWFECADEEELQILHIAALDPRRDDTRVDHRPRNERGRQKPEE